MMRTLCILAVLVTFSARAESLIATHTIRAQSVLAAEDVALVDAQIPGALSDPSQAIGQEARVTLYAGRAILAENLGSAALVERNQTVTLLYRTGGLSILTEGRALSRGAAGEVIKVMNLNSRATVTGTIGADGTVAVGPGSEG